MRFHIAAAGFALAGMLTLIAATIQVLRIYQVNAILVAQATTLLIIAFAIDALGSQRDAPPGL